MMNVQAHISGQISGQVPNQAGTQLPGLAQQNGNSVPQIQNLGSHHNTSFMDPEFWKARIYMQEKIYEFLMQRQPQPQEVQLKEKVRNIAKRLEDCLLKTAVSKDEYMNLDTLENRLHALVKRPHLRYHNQQYPPFVNSSFPVGTMIPTPAMSHGGNSNLMVTSSVDSSMIAASGCNSIAPTSVNTGSLLPSENGPSVGIHSGSFNSSDGFLSNGC